MARWESRSGAPRRILGLAASLSLTLGLLFLLEGLARLGPPASDFWEAQAGRTLLPAHRYLLWVNAPGERDEQGVPVRINSLGLRGAEPVLPKPPGVRRLLVTGDSVVYGFGVREEALFTQVAAARLGVEGWTAAVPGYSTYQTLNLLEMTGLSLEPDLVVIANLWSDLSVMGFRDREVLDAYASFGSGRLATWAGAHSALYRRVRDGLRRDGPAADARVLRWRDRPEQGAAGRRVPIDEYAANLDRLVTVLRSAGAQVAFLELPIRASVKGHAPGGSAEAYARVMRDTARRRGCVRVDGAAALRESGEDEAELWRDATHLDERGHALVGAALAEALASWAADARLGPEPTGEPRPTYVDPDPRPAAGAVMKVPDDMIP